MEIDDERKDELRYKWADYLDYEPEVMPCPYCDADIQVFPSEPQVFCMSCRANGPAEACILDAIEAWNRVSRLYQKGVKSS